MQKSKGIANSEDFDQITPFSEKWSDLGMYSLLKPICPKTLDLLAYLIQKYLYYSVWECCDLYEISVK